MIEQSAMACMEHMPRSLLQKEPLAAVQSMELERGGRDKKQVSISGVPGVVVKIRQV
jgi:hypothetical protein